MVARVSERLHSVIEKLEEQNQLWALRFLAIADPTQIAN
jgi:hypothetical protein